MKRSGSSRILSPEEITDLASLVGKLQKPEDAVSRYVISRLTDDTRKMLIASTGNGSDQMLRRVLTKELGAIIEGGSIFDSERFDAVDLSPKTRNCVGKTLNGPLLMRFNRLLLEDA